MMKKTQSPDETKQNMKTAPKMNGLRRKSKRLAGELLQSAKFRVSWNIKKHDAEMDIQKDQNRRQKRSEIRFLRFGSDLEGSEI